MVMAVIQKALGTIFTEKMLENFYDEIHDYGQEQYRFQAGEFGMHAQSEDVFSDWITDIQSVVEDNFEDYDLFEILGLKLDSEGRFIFEEPIDDMASSYKSLMAEHITKEYLLKKPNSQFINDRAIYLANRLRHRFDIDYDKEVNSEEEYNQIFVQAVKDANVKKIGDLFNSDSLVINHIYKHFKTIINNEIDLDYNEFYAEKDSKMHSNYGKKLKLVEDSFSFSDKVAETIVKYKKYSNLIKNHQKLDVENR